MAPIQRLPRGSAPPLAPRLPARPRPAEPAAGAPCPEHVGIVGIEGDREHAAGDVARADLLPDPPVERRGGRGLAVPERPLSPALLGAAEGVHRHRAVRLLTTLQEPLLPRQPDSAV